MLTLSGVSTEASPKNLCHALANRTDRSVRYKSTAKCLTFLLTLHRKELEDAQVLGGSDHGGTWILLAQRKSLQQRKSVQLHDFVCLFCFGYSHLLMICLPKTHYLHISRAQILFLYSAARLGNECLQKVFPRSLYFL